jgi:hypothetical protein
MKQYAARAKEIESFSVSSLIEGTVGTLDPSAPRLDDQREGRHAATANAAEKVVSRLLHRQNLQASPMGDNLIEALNEQSEMQDWRRRAGFPHVCRCCHESAGVGPAPLPGPNA